VKREAGMRELEKRELEQRASIVMVLDLWQLYHAGYQN
jgi:hypothetical protein